MTQVAHYKGIKIVKNKHGYYTLNDKFRSLESATRAITRALDVNHA